jgi:hypothetical protein
MGARHDDADVGETRGRKFALLSTGEGVDRCRGVASLERSLNVDRAALGAVAAPAIRNWEN